MAASSSSVAAHEAVQVLVASLADESPLVREASVASLKEIAPMDPLLVLSCCRAVSRGGRRRFGNMAAVFQVMAWAVEAMDRNDVDRTLMEGLAKTATSEMITSKDINADWQRSAARLLVSVGSLVPDLMMEEIFLHLSGPSSTLPAMVQILADFSLTEALQFTPQLKEVLSRILPVLGNVRDNHKPIFANAFRCWCEAVLQYRMDLHSDPLTDTDVMSFLTSVFELLLKVWSASRNIKVRISSIEALGQMVILVSRTQLKAALPRLIPTTLDLCRKEYEIAFPSTCSLRNLLNAALLSESGPPLIEFEELLNTLFTLLPMACVNIKHDEHSDFSIGLKTYNEVQHCFVVIGMVYPEDLLVFLLHRCQSKDEVSVVGALCVIKHLLPRLSEAWNSKRSLLIDAVKMLFDERSLAICMALSELLVVMASHCYLSGASGESSIEYLVHHCAISEEEIDDFRKEAVQRSGSFRPFQYKKLEVKFGSLSPLELRAICEKGLLLLTVTIPEMEHILWPFVLKMIIPKKYTGAVATVCKCISELSRHKSFYGDSMMNELVTHNDFPNSVDLFARLIVLLHDPLSREQLSTHILTVLCQLGPLFPRNMILFWQDEVPKMKAYISDPDDLKQDCSYLETWDNMIINFLAESLDVVRDSDWVISLGKAFSRQYDLYAVNGGHSALLHRCLGMLLQKVDDRAFVREKIEWMYKNADISVPTNRLGLAKGMGLVAASHLDTVLEKLKNILDNVGRSKFRRFLSLFYGRPAEDADDIHAALALMYGYAARYAPSTVIEARIDALVGTNMLSHLLHVRHPTAKQAVITAIDLLGHAVINAADKGISFPLKRRDMMLEYVLTLMGRDEIDGSSDSNIELLHTQTVALSACTTLVSLEPKLPMETRNHVMKATLGFFALPNHPADIVDPLIDNLITLLCAILLTSGEDGRSRSEQLLHILRQIDQFVSSSLEHQRRRGCLAVYELLNKFRALCSGGFPCVGSNSAHGHGSQVERAQPRNFNLPSAFVLPSRESLSLGERIMTYIPRCADTNYDVRKVSIQVVGLFFSIALSLPKLAGSKSVAEIDLEESYTALSSLEDVISILRRDASIDQSEVFNRVVSSVCSLLTKNELVTSLHACSTALCDKIKQSAEGAIQAVTEFILKRGTELNESEVSRTTQSLLSATMLVVDKNSRQEVLNTISCLAENTYSKVVFNDVLAAAGRDIATKDVSRLRGGWPMQDAFHAFSQHHILSSTFLEHVISVLNEACITKASMDKSDSSCHPSDSSAEEDILLAAVAALTALFRGGGKIGRKSVEQSYASVLSALILQLGSCSGIAQSGHSEPLWTLLSAFQSFCECVGDLEMGKILARHTEQNTVEKWIELIGEIARCISMKRPKEVPLICSILNKALDRSQRFQREAAAAALSDFICYSNGAVPLLEQMVEAMCLHVSDESPSVRSLCLRGLVQIPDPLMLQYISQVLGVIVALLEDPDESVQLTSVQCLMTVLKESPKDAVDPLLLSISLRLRYLQVSASEKMRSSAFAAYGLLSSFGFGSQHDAFLEQVHATLPRLVLHVNDEDVTVRQACRETLKNLTPLIEVDNISDIFNMQHFCSDKREDYQDFVRDLTRRLSVNFANKADTYLASAIQAFDAPWPVIQANAIYFSCNLLSLLEDQRSLAPYFSQVLGMVLGKLIRSTDAVVRATCSFAVGVLLRASNPHSWAAPPLDRVESSRRPEESVNQDSDGNPTS